MQIGTRTPEVKTLDEILQDTREPAPAIIDQGILLDKSMLLIYGKPKSRKSFLLANLALGIATGRSFAGFEIKESQPVFVFSAEGGYFPNRDRIKKMAKSMGRSDAANFKMWFNANLNVMDDEQYNVMKQHIHDFKPKVVAIDPLVRFHDVDENSSNKMAMVMNRLRSIIEELNTSIILIHHTGKDAEQGARGSSAITGEYDSAIHIKSVAENRHILSFDMRHVETPSDKAILFNPDTFWFEAANVDPVARLLAELCLDRGEPVTKKEFVDAIVKAGIVGEKGAYKRIDKAEDNGQILLLADERYCPLDSPFSDSPGESDVEKAA